MSEKMPNKIYLTQEDAGTWLWCEDQITDEDIVYVKESQSIPITELEKVVEEYQDEIVGANSRSVILLDEMFKQLQALINKHKNG